MPGDASCYVAHVSAVLHGSLTPHQIKWHLSLAEGYQLEAQYWIALGAKVEHCGIAKQGGPDRLRS